MADAIDGGRDAADLMDDTVIDPDVASVAANGDGPSPPPPKSRARHAPPIEGAEEVTVSTAPTSDDE